jgi:hypothetical protein
MRASLPRDDPSSRTPRLVERARPSTLPDSTTTTKKTRVSLLCRRRPLAGLHPPSFIPQTSDTSSRYFTLQWLYVNTETPGCCRPSPPFYLTRHTGPTCVRTLVMQRWLVRMQNPACLLAVGVGPTSFACLLPATRCDSPSQPLHPRLWRMDDPGTVPCGNLCFLRFAAFFSGFEMQFAFRRRCDGFGCGKDEWRLSVDFKDMCSWESIQSSLFEATVTRCVARANVQPQSSLPRLLIKAILREAFLAKVSVR